MGWVTSEMGIKQQIRECRKKHSNERPTIRYYATMRSFGSYFIVYLINFPRDRDAFRHNADVSLSVYCIFFGMIE